MGIVWSKLVFGGFCYCTIRHLSLGHLRLFRLACAPLICKVLFNKRVKPCVSENTINISFEVMLFEKIQRIGA